MIKWETFGKNLSFFHFQRSGFGRPFTAVKTHSAWARHFSLFLDAGFSTDGRRMKNKPRPAVLLFTHNKCMWHVSEGLRLGTGSRSLCWFCPRGTFVSWTSSHSSSVLPTEWTKGCIGNARQEISSGESDTVFCAIFGTTCTCKTVMPAHGGSETGRICWILVAASRTSPSLVLAGCSLFRCAIYQVRWTKL